MSGSNLQDSDAASNEASADFSKPWQFSDVVLVVGGETFHVHRSMLAMWSPVFSSMFTAQFKEQKADKIPLPGKKAAEFKEMLQVIYPVFDKEVHTTNCFSLLELAKEYMMTKLTNKCERFLLGELEELKFDCLSLLSAAEAYGMKELEKACIEQAKLMSFDQLKRNALYRKIKHSNFQTIVEAQMTKMESDILDKDFKIQALKNNVEFLKDCGGEALDELEKLTDATLIDLGNTDRVNARMDSKLRWLNRNSGSLFVPFNRLHEKLKEISDYDNV